MSWPPARRIGRGRQGHRRWPAGGGGRTAPTAVWSGTARHTALARPVATGSPRRLSGSPRRLIYGRGAGLSQQTVGTSTGPEMNPKATPKRTRHVAIDATPLRIYENCETNQKPQPPGRDFIGRRRPGQDPARGTTRKAPWPCDRPDAPTSGMVLSGWNAMWAGCRPRRRPVEREVRTGPAGPRCFARSEESMFRQMIIAPWSTSRPRATTPRFSGNTSGRPRANR